MSTSRLWAVLPHLLHAVLKQRPSTQIALWNTLIVLNLLAFLPKVMQIMCLFLKYCWPMNEAWAVLSWKKCKWNIRHGIFKAYWFTMTVLAAASHIILEVRENTGKKLKECASKIGLPNYTDDDCNLSLHNKRLLLLVRSPEA